MCRKSATPPRIRRGTHACLIAVIACLLGAEPAARGQALFLLAGTCFLNDTSQTFPASLYTVSAQHKLKLFRTVVSGSEGTTEILDDMQGEIYVTFPSNLGVSRAPTKVSIIHKRHPGEDDVVAFNPKVMPVFTDATATAVGPDLRSYALFTLFPEPPPTVNGHAAFMRFIRSSATILVAVAGNPSAKGPRMTRNDWSLYSHLTFSGSPGGPGSYPNPLPAIENGDLVFRLGGQRAFLGRAPPSLPGTGSSCEIRIAAADRRFLVFWVFCASDRAMPTTLHVHDGDLNSWKELGSVGSLPQCRIFGPWLATIAMSCEGTGGGVWRDPNPGHNDESDHWVKGLLPDVRLEFGDLRMYCLVPGTLILDNLVDGRRITLHTHEEDSEILDVRSDGLVLYRVNDEIFSAHIEGDKLGPSTLVVKDTDVPEVHWAFWSNASPKLPPPAKRPVAH